MPQARKSRSGLKIVTRPGRATFYLRGTIRGRRVFESAETADRGLAEEVRARRENELFRADLHAAPLTVSFSHAAESYLDVAERGRSTQVNVLKLVTHFGPGMACRAIDQAAIDRACGKICPGAAPASRLRQVITPAKAILNHAARRGWCDAPKFETVKAGGKRTDWLYPQEAEAMVAAASEKFRPLLTFLFCTGARVDEAIALTWSDVDLGHAACLFRKTKNGDDRLVDLPRRAVAALAGLPAPLDGPRVGVVFASPRGGAYRRTADAKGGHYGNQIKKVFATTLSASRIGRHVTPHHCRHSWASWHYALHRDLLRLKQDGGWRTLVMAERYVKLAPPGLAPAIAEFLGVQAPAGRVTSAPTRREIA